MKLPEIISTDPFSGKPFQYRPNGDDYLLYSVGPDKIDDGGRFPDPKLSKGPGDTGLTDPKELTDQSGNKFWFAPHMLPYKPPVQVDSQSTP